MINLMTIKSITSALLNNDLIKFQQSQHVLSIRKAGYIGGHFRCSSIRVACHT
jgi:hypothetical protein